MHGHFNLPPFGIIEKILIKIKGTRVFATTTSWVMVKNQPVIHLSISIVMRLAILNHAQRIESNNKEWKCNLSRTNHQTQQTITSQIFTNTAEKHSVLISKRA